MNLTTMAVCAVVLLAVLGAAYWMYRDRKAGKNSCGCRTSSCAGCRACPPGIVTMDVPAEDDSETANVSEGSGEDIQRPDE